MKPLMNPRALVALALCAACLTAQAVGIDIQALAAAHPDVVAGIGLLCVGDITMVMKSMDAIEAKLNVMNTKAEGEFKSLGQVSAETKTALDALGVEQRTLADRMLLLEQKGVALPEAKPNDSWGSQFTKSAKYADFAGGNLQKLRVEVKNTIVGSDTTVAPDRKPGIVAGAFLPVTMEQLLPAVPTSSNAIEYTRELAYTNNAAEAAEGAQKGESSVTFELINQPISTVAHWIKISKQLAADAPALAAYVDNRMRYGVNQKVDTQLVVGNGTAPNIGGTYKTGNFTLHGYSNAVIQAISTTFKKLVLIRKIMADLYVAGYPADAILLNAQDWATIEIELFTTPGGQTLYSVNELGQPRLFGLPVIQPIGMAADTFQVGRFSEAYTLHNREGVVVEMSDSDGDNFTKNLITLRAERRLGLAVEKPAAVRGGDLTPA